MQNYQYIDQRLIHLLRMWLVLADADVAHDLPNRISGSIRSARSDLISEVDSGGSYVRNRIRRSLTPGNGPRESKDQLHEVI